MKTLSVLLLALVLSGCAAKPDAIETVSTESRYPSSALYIVDHGWHVGLVIDARALESKLPQLGERFARARFYELGWGDAGYYQAREVTPAITLRAIFWSRGAVMHVVSLPAPPETYFPGSEIIVTCLAGGEVGSLLEFVSASFSRDREGNLVGLKPGLYGNSQFYGAVGRYHLLNTSNKWTAKALKSGGMDISPAFKLTAGSVMTSARKHRRAPDSC